MTVLNRHSIFFKLNLLFALALLVLSLLFALFQINTVQLVRRQEMLRGMELGHLLRHTRKLGTDQRGAALDEAEFTLLSPQTLPPNAKEVPLPRHLEPLPRKPFFTLYVDRSGTYYFRSRLPHDDFLVRDDRPAQRLSGMNVVFVLLLSGLIVLYVMLRRSLLPLRTLSEQIRRFAGGALDIDTASNRRDEIAAIANEFNDAAGQIRRLQASRRLFLRNIMHELKTPLTRGKLALAMMENGEQTAYLDRLFNRMDDLINRMATVEKVQSSTLERHPHRLSSILDDAVSHLYLDRPQTELLVSETAADPILNVDFALMSSALSNLLDNALKYAETLPVRVEARDDRLCVANHGAPLQRPIETYLQPFLSEHEAGGLGLGLSIADAVARAHGYRLHYTYEMGVHRFCIVFSPEIVI